MDVEINSVTEHKKPGAAFSGFCLKDWRLPTLAEAIQPLPSAMQCLTAEFGMGSGRTTAVLPPNCYTRPPRICRSELTPCFVKDHIRNKFGDSLKTTHRKHVEHFSNSRVEIRFSNKGKSDQAARPISSSQLNTSRCLHSWPIKRVVCPWSLGSLRSGKQYLGMSLALRCFQRLSLPHMATQRCP